MLFSPTGKPVGRGGCGSWPGQAEHREGLSMEQASPRPALPRAPGPAVGAGFSCSPGPRLVIATSVNGYQHRTSHLLIAISTHHKMFL